MAEYIGASVQSPQYYKTSSYINPVKLGSQAVRSQEYDHIGRIGGDPDLQSDVGIEFICHRHWRRNKFAAFPLGLFYSVLGEAIWLVPVGIRSYEKTNTFL